MLSTHFSKQVFIDALKANANLVMFLSTTVALILTLIVHGSIQGNLKWEYVGYAIVVSMAFCLWAVIDAKYRRQR